MLGYREMQSKIKYDRLGMQRTAAPPDFPASKGSVHPVKNNSRSTFEGW